MPKILAVDDDRSVLELVAEALKSSPSGLLTTENGTDALDAIRRESPDVLLLDIKLPDLSGLEMIEQVRSIDARLPIIFMTVSDSSDVAIEAIQKGAFDFLTKPLDFEKVQDAVVRALESRKLQDSLSVEFSNDPIVENGHDQMIGKSPEMLEVYKEVGRVAGKDVTVLICGESGTGKELVARAIYQHSERRDRPFLAVNCAALSESLLESELLGHEKGAFTGANQRHIGKFEQCNGGTLFLDEVGDMSPALQSKVLRLLQEQSFERVGGRETIETNVRIIAATNRDLEKMINNEEFRLDLYHRLNSFRIHLPPLRCRQGDLDLLVQHFFKRITSDLSIRKLGISPEAIELLRSYNWPGNIRQLQSVLRKAVLKSSAPILMPHDFPEELFQTSSSASGNPGANSNGVAHDLRQFIDERRKQNSCSLYQETQEFMERYLLSRLLNENRGNQSKSAQALGISRGRLRARIRALGITIEQIVEM